MRFLSLDLRAFGSFDGLPPLDLSGGDRGLHLIHGPNEAGKSTALRAIRCLLFGFPKQTADNHLIAYDKLRVAATLAGEAGETLGVARRKRDVRSLWTFDDAEPVAEETLERLLDGLDAARFDDLFAMDHRELVDGGRAILDGGGRLGEMLFSAGSGVANIDAVREAIDRELDALFKPTGKNPTINAALAELKEARDASEAAMLATSSWVDLDAELARARASKEQVDRDWRLVSAEKRRLERLRDALPGLDRLDRTLGRLGALGRVAILPDDFADRHRRGVEDRVRSTAARQSAERTLAEIAADLDALGAPDPILGEADAVRKARDDLGRYRQALEARPVDEARLARAEADARALLREIRPGASIEDAEALGPPLALKERIGALARELATLEERRQSAENEAARLGQAGAGPVADAPRLAEALLAAVERALPDRDLDAQVAAARSDLDRDARRLAVELKALPLWSGTLEDLQALAVPSTSTIDRFEAESREADDGWKRAEDALGRAASERQALEREVERGSAGASAPTEDELARLRDRRDDRWRSIRAAWVGGAAVDDPSALADRFEADFRAADDLADRLRREADLVAEQARRRARLRELVEEVRERAEARDRSRLERERVDERWRALWRSIGLGADPLPPREMRDWAAIRRAEVLRQAQGLRDREADLERRAGLAASIMAELSRGLVALGEPEAGPTESIAALLARSKNAVERVDAGLRRVEARANLARAEANLDAWRTRWAVAVGTIGLDADASTGQALAVLDRFDRLSASTREIVEARARVEEQALAEARFESAVRTLAGRLQPGSAPEGPVEATALALADRLERAKVDEGRRQEAIKRQGSERSRLAEARASVDRAEASLSALVAEAGCGSPEDLAEAERRSDEVKALRKEVGAIEDHLAALAGPVSLEALREEASRVDPAALEGRISELADRLAPLEVERTDLDQAIGRLLQRLDAMDGGPAAAEARQAVEGRIAALALDVEKYARLRLASAVLREAVERYRREHQGPVLERAGGLFAALTAGSFSGLKAEVDDKGKPVLSGVRAGGTTLLPVSAMSEGTADQLYLALRLASLHASLDDEGRSPMPLVVDDILVNFDDARALAALKALADLSRRTQVLFFTHHEHLVDLARSAIGDHVLFVHRLTYPPVRSAPIEERPAAEPRPKRRVSSKSGGVSP